jgi:hypothetical protein
MDSSPPKRPGRKPLDPHDSSVKVTATVTSSDFDALIEDAKQARLPLAELLRRKLRPPTHLKPQTVK